MFLKCIFFQKFSKMSFFYKKIENKRNDEHHQGTLHNASAAKNLESILTMLENIKYGSRTSGLNVKKIKIK